MMKRILAFTILLGFLFLLNKCNPGIGPEKSQLAHKSTFFLTEDDISRSGKPVIAHVGQAATSDFMKVESMYADENKEWVSVYFQFGESTFYKLETTRDEQTAFLRFSSVKKLPSSASSLDTVQNNFERFKKYPVKHEWHINENVSVECRTYMGCADTDKANIRILLNGEVACVISGLGWVTLAKYDIDQDTHQEIILVSTKLCEATSDFFVIKLP